MNQAIVERLRAFSASHKVSVGFDGYIDRILRVGMHESGEDHTIDTMNGFGAYIQSKAGKSCSLELRLVEEKIGGNMPNYAHCISRLGAQVSCVGALGWPSVHPLFARDLTQCSLYTVCQPGLCDALEFRDGKVMLAQNGEIADLDYEVMSRRLDMDAAAQVFAGADMLTFLNWSEMKGATSIWEGIGHKILPRTMGKRKPMLVDFSDCSGKSRGDIEGIAAVLAGYQERFCVYLSLNLNEAEQLALKLGVGVAEPRRLARLLWEYFHPAVLVIHLTNGCAYTDGERDGFVPNSVVTEPRILTGGGDNFNAGLSMGILMELDVEQALYLGNAVSGYYVSNGQSPDRNQLAAWMEQYLVTGGSV